MHPTLTLAYRISLNNRLGLIPATSISKTSEHLSGPTEMTENISGRSPSPSNKKKKNACGIDDEERRLGIVINKNKQ